MNLISVFQIHLLQLYKTLCEMKILNSFLKYILLIFFLLTNLNLFSQRILTNEEIKDSTNLADAQLAEVIISNNDTLYNIYVKEIIIFPTKVFKNEKEQKKYTRLMYNVKKVYPYSQLIKKELADIEAHCATLKSEKEVKDYLNEREKELMAQFKEELMDLTYSQGRILIKLVDRETGNTTYSLVKDFRGNLSAMFWQSIALMFDSSLKYEYDAEDTDKAIEEIILLIENGQF